MHLLPIALILLFLSANIEQGTAARMSDVLWYEAILQQIEALLRLLKRDCLWTTDDRIGPGSGAHNSPDLDNHAINVWANALVANQRLLDRLFDEYQSCHLKENQYQSTRLSCTQGLYGNASQGPLEYWSTDGASSTDIPASDIIHQEAADSVIQCALLCAAIENCQASVYNPVHKICTLLSSSIPRLIRKILHEKGPDSRQDGRVPRGPGLVYTQSKMALTVGPLTEGIEENQLVEVPGCEEAFSKGARTGGVYKIRVDGLDPFLAWCEFDKTSGWLVIQRRQDGTVDFYRTWAEYRNGFGDPKGEYWLGNERIHALTNPSPRKLAIYLEDLEGNSRFANFSQFQVANESLKYKLMVRGYSGTAGDSLANHNGAYFSTKDVDNDQHNTGSCATAYKGAWWYTKCHSSNLNGLYLNGTHSSYANGVNWKGWKGYHYSLTTTVMKVNV